MTIKGMESLTQSKIPVVLIFFRRRCVLEVLESIRDYAPEQLFLIADGGRTPKEHEQCQIVRQLVDDAIDWPCQVGRLYSDCNMGCRGNIPRGINWVFSQVDRAVILEDDTVPSLDFFIFCEEMLERYAEDTRIMTVSGANHFPEHAKFGQYSYLFSGYAITWGYATWRRAWLHYDADMALWPMAKENDLLKSCFLEPREKKYWEKAFDEVWSRTCTFDPYDFQWTFASFLQGGLSIVPHANLVTNVGSGPEATHTQAMDCKFIRKPTQKLGFPLKHPSAVARNGDFDSILGRYVWYGEPPTMLQLLRAKVVGLLPESIRVILRSFKR